MNKNIVLIKREKYYYPSEALFRPSKAYPEAPFMELSSEDNHVYDMVREGFWMMNYDREHYDSPEWNPLGELIEPGNTVLLKPNMVMHENHIKEEGTDCLYTHPSIVAAVLDYVIIALKGAGKIVVGDAPMQECDFENLIEKSGYRKLIEFYKKKLQETGVSIELVDFRGLRSQRVHGINISEETETMGKVIDLADESEFFGESDDYFEKIRITNYDPDILKKHHNKDKNEYFVNDNILKADVIINMPKPKTHRKAGVTISLKNLVGINCRKEYLPHHANGSIAEGGDEYLEKSFLKHCLDRLNDKRNYYSQTAKSYKKVWIINKFTRVIYELINRGRKDKYYEGSWYGNDTISRTIVDLNKILFYADKNGKVCNKKQRKYLIVADMIISGEKEGPVAPSPKNVGIIAMGDDPVCFDEAILELMGAKREYIHTIDHARDTVGTLELTENDSIPYLISNVERWNNKTICELTDSDLLYFIPTSGWMDAFKKPKG